jgi:hypothetical protein
MKRKCIQCMLSHAVKEVGSGWGFGIHEAIDHIGTVVGSLIISIILYFKGSYSESFLILNSVFLYFPNTFIKYCLIF